MKAYHVIVLSAVLSFGCGAPQSGEQNNESVELLTLQKGENPIQHHRFDNGVEAFVFEKLRDKGYWSFRVSSDVYFVVGMRNGAIEINNGKQNLELSGVFSPLGEVTVKVLSPEEFNPVVAVRRANLHEKDCPLDSGGCVHSPVSEIAFWKTVRGIGNRVLGEPMCSTIKEYAESLGYQCPWENNNALLCPSFYAATCVQ